MIVIIISVTIKDGMIFNARESRAVTFYKINKYLSALKIIQCE